MCFSPITSKGSPDFWIQFFQTDGDPDFIICNIDTYHKILPSGFAVDSLGIEIVIQVPF